MYKLNLIAVVSIAAAVSLFVGMASPAIAFAAQHASMNTTDNMGLMGNMTGGGNASSMAETENITTAGETGETGLPPRTTSLTDTAYINIR